MNGTRSESLVFPQGLDLEGRQQHFRDQLTSAGWVLPARTPGINPLGPNSILVADGLLRALARLARLARSSSANQTGGANVTALQFPPVSREEVLERTDYLASFPQLIGVIDTYKGDTKAHADLLAAHASGADWHSQFAGSGYSLTAAACHPLYDHLAGTVAEATCYELTGDCFRNEPSDDPMRRVSFRMREYVFLGSPVQCLDHRKTWVQLATDFLSGLGINVFTDVANDPFFGRAGKLLAAGQRDAELKFEILTEVYPGHPTAIASGNFHQDHFGQNFEITLSDGSTAHSACFGFGIERIMLALVARHGFVLSAWPQNVLAQLEIGNDG